jgi:transcriptional regulator with XRE-family HTH domain
MGLSFWENVNIEIKRQNTTQEWLSGKAGVKYQTFKGWISKEIYPRVDEAVHIANALGVTVEYLFLGRDASATYEDMRILSLAKKHLQTLEALDSMNEQTRDIIKAQIMAVAVKNTDSYMVAERESGNGSS